MKKYTVHDVYKLKKKARSTNHRGELASGGALIHMRGANAICCFLEYDIQSTWSPPLT